MEYNKIPIVFIGRKGTAPPISYQYDKKQVGVMEGVYGLPDVFTVDFCNDGDPVTKPVICTPESINIPDEYLITGRTIIGYFWLSGPNGSAQTRYDFEIPVRKRPARSEVEPTPEEQSVIDQLIEQLNVGVDRAETAADEAEQHEADAGADALKAEGYATGNQGGEPVTDESPYYHNNASYFAGQAGASATAAVEAKDAAEAAQGKAEDAEAGAREAKDDAQAIVDGAVAAVNQARDAAVQTVREEGESQTAAARRQAEAAARSASASAESADDAAAAKTASENAQGAAETAQEKAETAQGAAEDAQEAAETAQELSERAQAAAEEAARQAGERVGMIHDIDNQKYYSVSQEVRNGFLVETFTEVQNP